MIQTENGFILRPLHSHVEVDPDTRNSVVFETLAQVKDYLADHFRRTICPKCERPCTRGEVNNGYSVPDPFVRCGQCGLIKVDDDEFDWIAYPIHSCVSSDDPVHAQWNAQIKRYREKYS